MKKFKLNLDELEIESFSTTPDEKSAAEGTVHGYGTEWWLCGISGARETCTGKFGDPCCGDPISAIASCQNTCADTCDQSCGGTCHASCGGTCYTCQESCGGTCEAFCSIPAFECISNPC